MKKTVLFFLFFSFNNLVLQSLSLEDLFNSAFNNSLELAQISVLESNLINTYYAAKSAIRPAVSMSIAQSESASLNNTSIVGNTKYNQLYHSNSINFSLNHYLTSTANLISFVNTTNSIQQISFSEYAPSFSHAASAGLGVDFNILNESKKKQELKSLAGFNSTFALRDSLITENYMAQFTVLQSNRNKALIEIARLYTSLINTHNYLFELKLKLEIKNMELSQLNVRILNGTTRKSESIDMQIQISEIELEIAQQEFNQRQLQNQIKHLTGISIDNETILSENFDFLSLPVISNAEKLTQNIREGSILAPMRNDFHRTIYNYVTSLEKSSPLLSLRLSYSPTPYYDSSDDTDDPFSTVVSGYNPNTAHSLNLNVSLSLPLTSGENRRNTNAQLYNNVLLQKLQIRMTEQELVQQLQFMINSIESLHQQKPLIEKRSRLADEKYRISREENQLNLITEIELRKVELTKLEVASALATLDSQIMIKYLELTDFIGVPVYSIQ